MLVWPTTEESGRLLLSPRVYEYYLPVTISSMADLRSSLYQVCASQHADRGDVAVLIYGRDICTVLPSPAAEAVVDLGCGRGELTSMLDNAATRRAHRDRTIGHRLATILEKVA